MSKRHRRGGIPPTPATAPVTPGRSPFPMSPIAWQQFRDTLATELGEHVERRQFKAPALPPGVVPEGAAMACDSAGAGQSFTWLNAQPGWCGLGFPGYSYLSELAQRSEYRAPTETIASELTREWIKFEGGDEAKLKELTEAFEKFCVRDHFRVMALYDGLFGRGQLAIMVKGQDGDAARQRPLIIEDENKGQTLPKDSLLGFKPVEPIWTTPYMYNSTNPLEPNFYNPDWWYVLGKKTHSSRLLTFVSRPLPDMLKPSYNFGGMSLSQLIEPYVVRWLKTVDSVNRLISNFSLSGIATNMQATLEEKGAQGLLQRAAAFNLLRDNRGLMLTDKDSEEFFQFNTPLSGLGELQSQAQEHMAAPTHIPLVKLTGITPSGLNASSEEDLKVFYDFIGSEQMNLFNPHLITVSKAIQCHLWGAVDPTIRHVWVPLDSPSDKEESEMRKADGDRDTAYVTGGIVSADEVRERLRTDPNSGYAFIEGDAPTAPLEAEAELGEEGKQADHDRAAEAGATEHERASETADKDHERAVELARIAAEAKKKPAAK